MWTLPLLLLSVLSSRVATDEAYDPNRFESQVLARGFDRPMEMDVAPDGRVFVVEQGGKVLCYEPQLGQLQVALELDVFAEQENGLLGIALDPDFSNNAWVYLCYSPANHMGQFVSRFRVEGTRILPESERVLLSWIEQRRECCHHGGSLEFGPEGNLYISTGDNTNPFESSGFAPIDKRAGRFPWDAQRTSANSLNFSGKVLRIRPTPNGGYLIPPGNLFEDPSEGRPEIYVMGCRNPWRISIDSLTGYLYWGDVGPDSSNDGERGPRGYDELNQARVPGFFGWPLFIGDNFAYRDYDFAADSIGGAFDVQRPWNDSTHNAGTRRLPAAQPAWIYYPYSQSDLFPELGDGGRTACAGPVHRFDEGLVSDTKFPRELDASLLFYEWSRGEMKLVRLTEDSSIASIEDFEFDFDLKRPSDLVFGPRGALYVLDYGTTWGTNEDSALLRVDYVRGNRRPRARAVASQAAGAAPLTMTLDGSLSSDKDGEALDYLWTLHPGGLELSRDSRAEVTVKAEGLHTIELRVSDASGASSISRLPLAVGNEPPQVDFTRPAHGGFFDPQQVVPYLVHVDDLEDGVSEGDSDIKWWMDNVFVETQFLAGAPPSRSGDRDASFEVPGLALMKQSDCFNCHAIDREVVGPALDQIAGRYVGESDAKEASILRVQQGSTGVWGETQMLPHADLDDHELRTIMDWIYSLEAGAEAKQLAPGHVGEASCQGAQEGEAFHPESSGEGAALSGSLILEASYTDTGGEQVGPQVGRARRVLRTLHVEGEHFNRKRGNQVLESESATGGAFIGAIEHDSFLLFEDVNLEGIASVSCRVSSAGAGATVEFRTGSRRGALVGSFEMVPNGEWEAWFDVQVPLKAEAGARDLFIVFTNEESGGGLMNLDSLRFEPND